MKVPEPRNARIALPFFLDKELVKLPPVPEARLTE